MNRGNEEQRPVAQTLCGALQKEPNCKCLLLSILIYTCLAAITWCRCANVTKIMVNFANYPIRTTKTVSSPCDEGYIYIPVAFMGMLYLVYLVECYHSPIRIDLLHAENQDSVLSKLAQLKMAQPTIWWRAVSYHYVRRKRQITRYRNGDNYTTTQVYYERVNTHVATSAYYYDYCGVKDISKDLILGTKIPITKITLTKGFAFSNMRSATEFEETRSRFFAEQELRDDYLEMREGLDIGNNVNPTMLVAVLGNPWFTNRYVYWCLSALLLSWPLRVIIEYKTQYADYQVTKLFGVNYDTPTSGEPIHASISQLSQPGSYMLAPSYSEALLMDPAPANDGTETSQETWQAREEVSTDMVPSYSEALLYERAEQLDRRNVIVNAVEPATVPCNVSVDDPSGQILSIPCECHCPCPCHGNTSGYEMRTDERDSTKIAADNEPLPIGAPPTDTEDDSFERQIATLRTTADGRLQPPENPMVSRSASDAQTEVSPSRCGNCGRISTSTQTINADVFPPVERSGSSRSENLQTSTTDLVSAARISEGEEGRGVIRDISEPNLQSRSKLTDAFAREYVSGLRNTPENREEPVESGAVESVDAEANPPNARLHVPERQERIPFSFSPCPSNSRSFSFEEPSVSPGYAASGKGAIPKTELRGSKITVNPMSNEACWKLSNSKTYFCLKSILKQDKRRYTLVTTDEFQNLADQEANRSLDYGIGRSDKDTRTDRADDRLRRKESWINPRRRITSFEESMLRRDKAYANDQKQESTRTLIFPSRIQEIPTSDPFGGKDIVPSRSSMGRREWNVREDPINTPMLACLSRSSTDWDRRRVPDHGRHRRTFSVQQEHPVAYPFAHSPHSHQHRRIYRFPSSVDHADDVRTNNIFLPLYDDLFSGRSRIPPTIPPPARVNERRLSDVRLADVYSSGRHRPAGLTRSFTERRPKLAHIDRNFRRSFTGRVEDYRTEDTKRTNFSMETSL